jgi:hypothetical protein
MAGRPPRAGPSGLGDHFVSMQPDCEAPGKSFENVLSVLTAAGRKFTVTDNFTVKGEPVCSMPEGRNNRE